MEYSLNLVPFLTTEIIHQNNMCIHYTFIKLLYKLNSNKFQQIFNQYLAIFKKDQKRRIDVDIKPITIILVDDNDNIIIITDNKIIKEDNTIKLEKSYGNLYDLTKLEYKLVEAYNKNMYYLILFKNNFRFNRESLISYFVIITDNYTINKTINKYFEYTGNHLYIENENIRIDEIYHTTIIKAMLLISFIELYITYDNTKNKLIVNDIFIDKKNNLIKTIIPLNNHLINTDNSISVNKVNYIPNKIDYVVFKNYNIIYCFYNISITYYNKYIYLQDNNIYILKDNFLELLSEYFNLRVKLANQKNSIPEILDNNKYFRIDNDNIYIDNKYYYEPYIYYEIKKLGDDIFNKFKNIYNNERIIPNKIDNIDFMKINKQNFINILKDYLHVLSEDTKYYKLLTEYNIPLYYDNDITTINDNIKTVIKNFKSNNKTISLDEKYILSIYDYKLETKFYTDNINEDNIYKLPNNKYIYIFETDRYKETQEETQEETREKIMKTIYIIENPKQLNMKGGRNKKFKVFYNDKKNKYYINYENRKRYLNYRNTCKENSKFYMKIGDNTIELYM